MNSQVKIDISKKKYNNVTITWNQTTVNREREHFFRAAAKNDAEAEYSEKFTRKIIHQILKGRKERERERERIFSGS